MNPFSKKPRGVDIESARDIEIETPDWNLTGYLARGMVTVLDGHDPHLTECIAVELAAIQSRSVVSDGVWPDGTQATRGRVLFVTTHRNAGCVLMPLVLAAQPNWSNFDIIRRVHESSTARVVDMTTDAWDIDAKLQGMDDVGLIVYGPLDPSALKRKGRRDEVNRIFEELAGLAEKHDAAVLVITHALKNESSYKAAWSAVNSAWFPSAPVLLLIAASIDGGDGGEHGTQSGVLVPAWSKFGPTQGAFGFDLDAVRVAASRGREAQALRVTWAEPIPGPPKAILDSANRDRHADESAERFSQIDRAKSFLVDVLADGPMRKEAILDMAEEAHISDSTLERARKALGVEHAKERGKPHGKFIWSLPDAGRPEHRRDRGARNCRDGDVGGGERVDEVVRSDRVDEVGRVDRDAVGQVEQVGRGVTLRPYKKDLADRLSDAIRHAPDHRSQAHAYFMQAESQLPDLDGSAHSTGSGSRGFLKAESELPDLDIERGFADGRVGD